MGKFSQAGSTGGALASGDVQRAVEQAGKAPPILGPFSAFNKDISKGFGDWNFNGE